MTDQWKEAIAHECTMAFIPFDENDPAKALNDLISYHIEVALDPRVSERARALAGQAHGCISSTTEKRAEEVRKMPGGYEKAGYVMRTKSGEAVIVDRDMATWLTGYQMYCLKHNHVKFGSD